jgi:cytochrome c-type biogenesis protein CcmH/NrfG
MKNLWIVIIIVVIIGALAGLAFFTHLEKPQQAQQTQAGDQGMDPDAMMAQVTQQVEALKQKIEQNPKDVEAYVALGNLYFDANMPPQAVEYYTKAAELDPHNSNVWTDLGTMHRHNGELDKAIECYEKATKADPKNKNAWFNMGIVYKFDKNQPKQALFAWKKFLELVSPDDPHYESLKKEVADLEAQVK